MSNYDKIYFEQEEARKRHEQQMVQARAQVEDDIDHRYAEATDARYRRGLARMRCGDWAVDQLIDNQLLEVLHVNQLRRISQALGHPFAGDRTKSISDLIDLAVERLGKAAA